MIRALPHSLTNSIAAGRAHCDSISSSNRLYTLPGAAFHDHERRAGDSNWSEPFRYVMGAGGGDDDGHCEGEADSEIRGEGALVLGLKLFVALFHPKCSADS